MFPFLLLFSATYDEERFFNFGFPGDKFTPGAINGKQWKSPTVSAISQMDELELDCDLKDCGLDKVH